METNLIYLVPMEQEQNNRIVLLLLRLGAQLAREGGRILTGTGLNQQQFVVLNSINTNSPLSQKEICSSLLFEKSNLSKIVSKLILLKLIKKEKSMNDRRIDTLRITKKGEQTVNHCLKLFNEWNKGWLKPLTGTKIRQCLKVLENIGMLPNNK